MRGFQELQNLDIENGEYFLASQLLSQGLERMMKVILFLSTSLQPGYLKDKCHDLEELWQQVGILNGIRPQKNKNLNRELKILSEFNMYARYYYIDILDGKEKVFDPQKEWEKQEDKYFRMNPHDYMKLAKGDEAVKIIQKINRSHIIPLEKMVCVLSRIIVNKQVNGWNTPLAFKEFANYNEKDFGKTDYTTWPQCLENKYKPHKITWKDVCADFLYRFFGNRKEKSKVVIRNDFDGIWPFREISDVKVISRRHSKGEYYLISIAGYLCALNGKTAAELHLPTPYRAGLAEPGCSIKPFLDIALKLQENES